MMSLFSSFDLFFFKTWIISSMLVLLWLNYSTYKISSLSCQVNSVSMNISKSFSSIKLDYTKGTTLKAFSLMLFLFISNISSVVGFVFPLTSQISVVLFMGASFWVLLMLFKLAYNIKGFLLHCIPESAPLGLTLLLFAIEVVSNLIRPLTVSVRLVANILAGHLLMILLSQMVLGNPLFGPFYLGLNLVEMFVAVIQSYIFSTMIWLYYSEV